MTAEAANTSISMSDTSLKCPSTGQLCPSRIEIARLCDTEYSEDMTAEELALSANNSRAQTLLLMGHNRLINQFGCSAVAGNENCPPSIASNEQPAIRGAKRLIKLILGGMPA